MKKLCAIALFACLLLPLAGRAQAYITVAGIHEKPPARWTQAYETKWRTVSIDVQPVVPQADKLPILKVIPDFWQPDVSALSGNWTSELNDRGTFYAKLNDIDQEYNDAMKRKKGKTTTTNYYPPLDMNAAYAKNNGLTLGDVINHLRLIMDGIGEEGGQWQYGRPTRVMVNTTVSTTTGEPLLPGSYTVFMNQELHGIPVLCHVLSGVDSPKDQELHFYAGLTFDIRTPETISLVGRKLKVTDMPADDVPLCDFSVIQLAIEQEIMAGHIRKIFDVELGYA